MEKNFKLQTSDGHLIHGYLNYKGRKPQKALIFVHGLTGHPNEHIFYNGMKHFVSKGFAVFRFALYTNALRGRRLNQCTLKIHAKDLNRVISYAKRHKMKEIFVVGHSLGGPTILLSDTSLISGIVLWDPTYDPKALIHDCSTYDKRIRSYVIDWGVKHLWGEKMCKEMMAMSDCGDLLSQIDVPTKIIAAGAGVLVNGAKKYYASANKPKSLSLIAGAGHCFDEEGTEKKLFSETYRWVKKFSS